MVPHVQTGLHVSRPTLRRSSTLPFVYGAITRYGRTFQTVPLGSHRLIPTGLFRVRSPLLAESRLISIPPGTEMFQFPGFASACLCIQHADTAEAVGFPIRTSPDQSLFASSPRLFAGYYVLHRLLPPRHPPRSASSLDHITFNRSGAWSLSWYLSTNATRMQILKLEST